MRNDERRIKETDEGLDFSNDMVSLESFEVKNMDFLNIVKGGKAVVVIKWRFYGVFRVMEIEGLEMEEIYELKLSDLLQAMKEEYADTLFRIPECMKNSDCYNMDGGVDGYCAGLCDSSSDVFKSNCPDVTGECYKADEKCFECFGVCRNFKCEF